MIRRVLSMFVLSGAFILPTNLSHGEIEPLVPAGLHELTITPIMVDGLPAEGRELLEEYRTHYLRVVDLYRSIKIVANRKEYIREQDENSENQFARSLLTYRSNGGTHLRMDEEWLDDDGIATGRQRVRMARPEGYLIAEKQSRTSEYVIVGNDPSFDEGEDEISGYYFQWAPHSIYSQPAHRYLFSNWVHELFEGFRIAKVTVERRGDAELVSFYVSGKGKRSGRDWEGEFVFDRSRGWVLTGYRWGVAQIASDDDYVRHAAFEYSGTSDGVGLLSKARYWIALGPQGREQTQGEFEVVEVVPGPVPLSEFSSEAIGIGRPGRQRIDRIWTVVGLLIGGGLIAVYVFLRRRESLARSRP